MTPLSFEKSGAVSSCQNSLWTFFLRGGGWRTPPTASGLRKPLSQIDVTALEDALDHGGLARGDTVTHSKGHGRREKRTLTSTNGAERLPATRARLVPRQAGHSHHPQMRVDRPHHGERQTSRETVYGITSLPRDQAHAARLRELHRHRWTIENSVFYIR